MTQYDVVVIGAGAAGLGASYFLRTQPINYLVLEASDRAGGRAHTILHQGYHLDLGAGWLHHGRKNSLIQLAQAQNKKVLPVGLESFATLPSAYEFETACAHIDVQLESAANHQLDQPAANFIEETFNEIHPAAYWMCNIDMGTTSVNTSVMSWMNMVCDGENLFSPRGYGSIIEDGFQYVPVQFNTQVSGINTKDDGVIIETSNGPIQTKKCICTVSMGVLNGHQIKFTPELPPWKRRAFNDMQMGHLLKVHLELHDTHGFPEDTWIYEHHEHYNYFFYHVRPAGCPWVVAYLGGDHAKEVGKKDKETLATLLQTPLVKRYQCLAKETFGETFFKDWSSQPHILGSYASHRPGEYPLNNNLNRPVDNKLFFAGEAFAGAYGQTVDGAFNSGQSTAQELVRSLLA